MRNEKGEALLFCVLVLVALSGLLTLCGLKLQHSFNLMEKRTNLFLCVKETKGEFHIYMKAMGRLNWMLKNVTKAQKVAIFFPPLWPYVGNAEKLKRAAKGLQAMTLAAYTTKISQIKLKGCPLDPHMVLNPYQLGTDSGFQRSLGGEAILRSKKWTYYFLERPYLLSLEVDGSRSEGIFPKLIYRAKEKGAILSSLLSSR